MTAVDELVLDAVARTAADRGHDLGVPVWTQVRADLIAAGEIRARTVQPWPRQWP